MPHTGRVTPMTDEANDADPDETRLNISESADKVRLETKIKRGEGTRDQDEIKIKVKGSDPQEAAEKLHETVVAVGSLNTVNALRGTQPSSAQDDD